MSMPKFPESEVHIKNKPVILSEAYFSGVEGPAFGALHGLRLCFRKMQ
jgi:hypothetical protein